LIVSPIVFFAATLPWRIEPHDVTFDISLGAWYAVLLAVIAWRPHPEPERLTKSRNQLGFFGSLKSARLRRIAVALHQTTRMLGHTPSVR